MGAPLKLYGGGRVNKDGRYDAKGFLEGQFEPGSDERVLKNLPGIKSAQEMDDMEARELQRVMAELIDLYDEQHKFITEDLKAMHKRWLGEIYAWAGEYRQVNLSKGHFPFAAAARLPALMENYETEVLAKYTPCNFRERADVVRALAEAHVELILIHPFRDGNGRLARLLSILMALQAGLPLLDFSVLAEERKQDYFAAVQSGLDNNYEPMERLFALVIEKSLAAS